MNKKFFLAFVLTLSFACIACGEEIKPWNIESMIRPELKQDFINMPVIEIKPDNLDQVRKFYEIDPAALPKDPDVEVHNEFIGNKLRIRVYTPVTKREKLPGLLLIHGGGHLFGTPEGVDEIAITIAKRANCIVAAPDYRLAPEFPYPADLDDCMSALKWLAKNPRVNADKIAVMGTSAGGGLTASVTLKARDEGGPAICFQMPLYPMLDCRNITPSSFQITDSKAWDRKYNLIAWDLYLNGKKPDIYASPALAEDLSNLPPAYIMVGTLDPFRDETIIYAQKLMQAGVPVELHVIPGVIHAFEFIFSKAAISINAQNEYIDALVNALN